MHNFVNETRTVFPVFPYSRFVSGSYDFRNINMNKQCSMSSAFIGPASLQIFDMTFDKRMALLE